MEPQVKTKTSAKDFFINLGAIAALYTLVYSLINLLFTVINKAYPKIGSGYNYFGSESISWPVATLIVFFPIFVLLMWLLEKEYRINPEKQNAGIHRWLTFVTLFLSGLTIAIDLVTTLYYFIDGRELTTGFLLKVLVLLIVVGSVFLYYISDLRNKLTTKSRIAWRVYAAVIVLGSIVWGFAVLGSPRTQQLIKYDQQKVNDLQNISSQIDSFYANRGVLPKDMEELNSYGSYYLPEADPQTKKSYEYERTGNTTYNLCAEFNKASDDNNSPAYYPQFAKHGAGRHCYTHTVNPSMYGKPVPMRY